MTLAVAALLLAGLFAAVAMLPKQRNNTAVVAAVSVLGVPADAHRTCSRSRKTSTIGWAFWLILVFALLQTGAAIAALLFDSGIVTPPAPKPKYDQQQQFGQYGAPGGYYGGPSSTPVSSSFRSSGRVATPRSTAAATPVSPPPAASRPHGPQGGSQSGPPTPPTGFPTYGQPQQPTSQNPGQQQSPSSQQSGPAPS